MLTFALLTFYNLKKRQRQRQHLQPRTLNRDIRQDTKVLFTLLMQLLVYFISTVLYSSNAIYVTITQNMVKSTDRQAIENFIYIYPGLSFFAFAISPQGFRKELLQLRHLFRFQRLQRVVVLPRSATTNPRTRVMDTNSNRIF